MLSPQIKISAQRQHKSTVKHQKFNQTLKFINQDKATVGNLLLEI
jgi:hypothetical protein